MALRDKFFSDNIKIGNMPCIAFLNFGICPGSLSKEGFEILSGIIGSSFLLAESTITPLSIE